MYRFLIFTIYFINHLFFIGWVVVMGVSAGYIVQKAQVLVSCTASQTVSLTAVNG
jgi:hypothetical protein